MQLAHVAPAPPADHIPGTHATHVEDEEDRAVPGSQGRGSLQIDLESVLPLGVKVVDGHVAVHVYVSMLRLVTEAGMSAPYPKQRTPDIFCEFKDLRRERGVRGERMPREPQSSPSENRMKCRSGVTSHRPSNSTNQNGAFRRTKRTVFVAGSGS